MSAFVAVAYPHRVELVSDGATVTPSGTVAMIRSKTWKSASLPIAFAGRGNVGALMHVGIYLARASEGGTVDATLEQFAADLAEGLPKLKGALIDGVVCAMSETSGPHVLYFTTSSTIEGFAPFQLHDMPAMAGGSDPTPEALAEFGFPDRLLREPLEECGADVIEVMRKFRMAHTNQGGHEVYGIGGFAELTVVSADGLQSKVLRTWADKPGNLIDPHAGWVEL